MERMASTYEWVKKNRLILVLFAVGALARLLYAGAIPAGFNQDEASIGYDAYAILHYGIDRNGIHLPIHLIAWGSGQNALYAYLSMPFILLFGLNELSVRAVNIVFGLVGMIAFYMIAKQLFKQKEAAGTAMFLIAICPWHMMMSRWALESNLFPTLVLLAVLFLFKSIHQPRWFTLFAITIAISLYAYGTAYFFVPVFVLGVLILFIARKKIKLRTLLLNIGIMVVLGLPILLFLLINRLGKGTIETWLFSIPKLTVPRVEQVSSVFQGNALQNAIRHLDQLIQVLVNQSDGLLWNAIPPYGYMYPIALPLMVVGLYAVCVKIGSGLRTEQAIIAIWGITAVLMSLITDININRINIVFFPLVLLTVAGLMWLKGQIKHALPVALAAFAVFFVMFCGNYFVDYPKKAGPMFYESFGDAVRYASDQTDGTIYVTNNVNMPYIYVLFYERIDPHTFLDTVVYSNPGAPFQFVSSFGRYEFGLPAAMEPGGEAVYILSEGDPLPSDLSGYQVKEFMHYTVVSKASR
ncbi:hypothetical protein J2T15_000525 [Paenibacillus harenae]|uniref:Glycosyltransferase RgtA/B/C/D-like domain-containing protein n=2 Tax=Paenibacillus harenae TaxID=306543 RepID=A0ABT9TUS0_PAEHA|nr:hypothetical protein [Paenibacillus harenae]